MVNNWVQNILKFKFLGHIDGHVSCAFLKPSTTLYFQWMDEISFPIPRWSWFPSVSSTWKPVWTARQMYCCIMTGTLVWGTLCGIVAPHCLIYTEVTATWLLSHLSPIMLSQIGVLEWIIHSSMGPVNLPIQWQLKVGTSVFQTLQHPIMYIQMNTHTRIVYPIEIISLQQYDKTTLLHNWFIDTFK